MANEATGTLWGLPNYTGELFTADMVATPFLSMIGGLTGGRPADGVIFSWSTYDLRASQANRSQKEGERRLERNLA